MKRKLAYRQWYEQQRQAKACAKECVRIFAVNFASVATHSFNRGYALAVKHATEAKLKKGKARK
jgi:nitrogenase molybdenum-iron protein alpha/beta subunit